MELTRFKVINFRSIEESSWIKVSDNTCLVGTNEAGKTNLLLALWKLNPANDEPIVPLDDFPRHLYSNFKSGGHSKDVFIKADFELNESLQLEVAQELGCDIEQVKTVLVQRRYDAVYYVTFPYTKIEKFPSERIIGILTSFKDCLAGEDFFIKENEPVRTSVNALIDDSINSLTTEFIRLVLA